MSIKRVVLPLAVVVLAVALLPFLAGWHFERKLRDAVDEFNQQSAAVTLEVASYERGWAHSTFAVRAKLAGGPELMQFPARVTHGPIGGFNLVSGTSAVELRWPGAAGLQRHYFGDESPLSIRFSVGLGETVDVDVTSVAVDKPLMNGSGMRIVVSASHGKLVVGSDRRYTTSLDVPSLSISEGRSALVYEGLALRASGRTEDAQLEHPAETTLSVKSVKGSYGAGTIDIADANLSFALLPMANSVDFRFAAGSGAGRSTNEGSRLGWHAFDMQWTLSGTSRAALTTLTRDLRRINDPKSAERNKEALLMSSLAQFGEALLQQPPELALDRLSLDTGDGALIASARIAVDTTRWKPDQDMALLASALRIDAKIALPRAMAVALLSEQFRKQAELMVASEGGSRTPETVQSASARLAERALAGIAETGIIADTAPVLRFDIVYRNGAATVNGVPMQRLMGL